MATGRRRRPDLSACGPSFTPSPSDHQAATGDDYDDADVSHPCPVPVRRPWRDSSPRQSEGALQPLIATYRLSGPGEASRLRLRDRCRAWRCSQLLPATANYKYETVADGLRYEFVANSSGYFECLTKLAENDWTCRGPISPGDGGVGGSATIGSYDVEPDLTDYLGPPGGPAPITTRDVNGFRLSCISYTEKVTIAVQTWCITGRGVLGYIAGAGFLRGIELVSLSLYRAEGRVLTAFETDSLAWVRGQDGAGVRTSRICLLRDRLNAARAPRVLGAALRQEPSRDLLHSLNEPRTRRAERTGAPPLVKRTPVR